MSGMEIGSFAISKCGHDKDKVYVIVKADNEYVYLVDGKNRTINCPKRKNIKHIQLISAGSDEIRGMLIGNRVRNEDIKRAIKLLDYQL